MKNEYKQFPWRIFYRVAFIQALLVILAVFLSGYSSRHFFRKYFIRQAQAQLRDSLVLLSHSAGGQFQSDWCERVVKDTQIQVAVVFKNGTVLCRSSATISGGETVSANYEVPGSEMVLSAAMPAEAISRFFQVFNNSLGFFLLLCTLGLLAVSLWAARSLVFPIGRLLAKTQGVVSPISLSGKEEMAEPFGEWSEIESNIDDLRRNLEKTAQTLTMEQIELDTMMAAISDAILAVDLDGVPLFYNSRFEMLFGTGGIRRGIKLFEIFRDPEILSGYKHALKDGKLSATKAFLHEGSGEKRYFSLAVSPLRKQGGSVYGALGIFHDITELKAAEQMRIDFVANVSHELRTPLTAIKGYAETLASDVEKSPQKFQGTSAKEHLSVITRNTSRLMNLMEDLLDLSSIESATILQRDVLSTEEITNRAFKQIQPKCEKKNQKIEFEYAAKTVFADPNRLEQVLINLFDNAHKYTPEGGRIKAVWEPDRKGGKDVFLKLSDTGPGIEAEHQRRLFERFYRVDKARSREQGGTGLGLAIVKHIMQRHEGSVWIESEIGNGATFVCRFPA